MVHQRLYEAVKERFSKLED